MYKYYIYIVEETKPRDVKQRHAKDSVKAVVFLSSSNGFHCLEYLFQIDDSYVMNCSKKMALQKWKKKQNR